MRISVPPTIFLQISNPRFSKFSLESIIELDNVFKS